jgi:hypothetical protein
MATKKRKRFNEGGMTEAEDKARGLESSKEDKVGFFERLRMGNIDEEGSEAYRRFGAGRGRNNAEITPAREPAQYRADPYGEMTQAQRDERVGMDDSVDELEAANARPPITVPAGPRAELPKPVGKPRVNAQAEKPTAPAKSSPKMQEQTYRRTSGDTGVRSKPDTSNYSNEGRGRAMTKEQQFARAEAEARSPEGVAKRKKQESEQGLERVTPETALLPGGGLKALSEAAKKLAAPKMAKYAQEALPAPTKRLGYDKAGSLARKRSERADMRREEMLRENAKRYGLDEDAPGYEAAAAAVRKGLGGKDFGLKKGGSVKRSAPVKKMASGGMVSSASKRADGIATKGKTRCKMR